MVMLIPYQLMYRLPLAPWERRPVIRTWQQITDGPGAADGPGAGCGLRDRTGYLLPGRAGGGR